MKNKGTERFLVEAVRTEGTIETEPPAPEGGWESPR
jgi:hypothetical protein